MLVKSFISGLTFGSEVFLVAAMISDAPRLAALARRPRALAGRRLHARRLHAGAGESRAAHAAHAAASRRREARRPARKHGS